MTRSNQDLNDSVNPPPPDYSDEEDDEDYRETDLHMTINAVADEDELEQDTSDRGELLGEDGEEEGGEYMEDSCDEWDNDDDAGYVQIVVSEQEFIELEEVGLQCAL
jgi:hypothetical protein